MPMDLPAWALESAGPQDRQRVVRARALDTWQVTWPQGRATRDWAKRHGWPTPLFGLERAFLTKMLESDENFALALRDSGITVIIPVQQAVISDEELHELDALYEERGPDGRPASWGILVEELRAIRRAVEAGVVVTVDDKSLKQFDSFYSWAHGRYHMLEDGYDSWIGDDKS